VGATRTTPALIKSPMMIHSLAKNCPAFYIDGGAKQEFDFALVVRQHAVLADGDAFRHREPVLFEI